MARILFFPVLLLVFFLGGFAGAHWLKNYRAKNQEAVSIHPTAAFQPTLYPIENLPFVIVIIGKNNGAWLEKTLQSAFSQNYPNYRIIYVDDGSDDGSFELARDLIEASPHSSKVTLLHNDVSWGALPSLKRAVLSCSDREIVALLHGEDQLAHEWVLQRLNQYYANPDLWMTYGQYLSAPSYQFGGCRPFQEGEQPRSAPFFASHLKTFYVALFKKIEESDFLVGEQGLSGASEMAIMVPMLELAKEHAGFIPDILYITSGARELMSRNRENQIRSLPSYPPLTGLAF